MQSLRAFRRKPLRPARADVVGDRRRLREALRERLEIEPGAAHQRRPARPRRRLPSRPAPGRRATRRPSSADPPATHGRRAGAGPPSSWLGVGPRCEDAQRVIDLHRIGIDDPRRGAPRRADVLGQLERGCRLAARGRPGYQHRARIRSRPAKAPCAMSYRSSPPMRRRRSPQNDVDLARRALDGGRRRCRFGRVAFRRARPAISPSKAMPDAISPPPARALGDRPIDVNVVRRRLPPQAAPRRRHGFHHDRAGMHRRAGRRDRARGAKSPPSPSAPCAARSRSSRRSASASPC